MKLFFFIGVVVVGVFLGKVLGGNDGAQIGLAGGLIIGAYMSGKLE